MRKKIVYTPKLFVVLFFGVYGGLSIILKKIFVSFGIFYRRNLFKFEVANRNKFIMVSYRVSINIITKIFIENKIIYNF